MKKKISFIFALLIVLNLSVLSVCASGIESIERIDSKQSISQQSHEETEWVYRYNTTLQKTQKRLFSNTSNKWLTDWIDA